MPKDLRDIAEGFERPSRLPLYLGVMLLVAGWVVLIVGWYQAGQQDLETGQIPYVISGGFGGFGLIIMGVIGILVDVVRQAETKLRRSADELHRRMEDLAETFVEQRLEAAKRPAASPVQRRTRRRAAAD
jgi:hypothetical protein